MRSPLAVAWLAVSLVACGEKAPLPAPAATASAASTAPTLGHGTEIVAATGPVSFRGGSVVRVTGDEVTFEYGRPDKITGEKATLSVESSRAFVVASSPTPRVGDFAICKVAEHAWYPCKIEEATGSGFDIVDQHGRKAQLAKGAIVVPDEPTRKAIAEYLAREARRRSFDEAFEAAGAPMRPPGWDPKPNDKVVIHFVGTSWYGGNVVEHLANKKKLRIQWEGKTWQGRDVSIDEAVPEPITPLSVSTQQFVLARPTEPTLRWEHSRVVSTAGDVVVVANRDGVERKLAPKDVIPIVPAPARAP